MARDTLRPIRLLGATMALCACLAAEGEAGAASPQDRRDKAFAEGRQLLDEGRWDEALCAFGPWGKQMGEGLAWRLHHAERRGDTPKRLQLCQVYLHYYPFGQSDWAYSRRSWSSVALDYAELLKETAAAEADESLAQTIAAAPKYQELTKAYDERKEPLARALAAEIVAEHPKSIFCPAAVLTLASLRAQVKSGSARAAPVCEEYLPLLERRGASERSRLLVLWGLAEAYPHYASAPAGHRTAAATYLEIRRRTDIAYEKRVCLLNAAQSTLAIGEGDAFAQSRKLYHEFLDTYPAVPEADQARRGLVQTYLAERKPEEALQALRSLQKRPPQDVDLSQPLFDISQAYFGTGKYEESLALLREIVERYPHGAAAPTAWIGLGEVYGKLGREAEMVDAYRKAAAEPSVETQTNIMDASNTRSRAHEWLGNYYRDKGDWEEALKWWRAWEPVSWCGTCAASMESRKAHGIAFCQVRMGKVDEALKTLEPMVFGPKLYCGADVAAMLVDIYRDRGKLDALESRLRNAVKKDEHNYGAKAAADYLALVRMAERGDVEGLWQRLTGHPFLGHAVEWQVAEAARLLVSIPEKAKPYALRKTDGEGEDPLWASVLLARMRAPETLALVRAKIQTEENWARLRDYFYALALLGTDDAYAVLKDCAAGGERGGGPMATRMLEQYPKPGDAAKALPR